MKKENDTSDIPSKSSIIKAWVALIILSLCLAGLIYAKKTYKPKETNIEEDVSIPNVIVETLNNIVDNFNSNKKVVELKDNNIVYEATLEDMYIVISSTKDENTTEIKYEYDMFKHSLSSSATDIDKEIFIDIFKLLVESCQTRLENTDNVQSYIDKFLNGEEVYGLLKEEDIYSIDIIVKLGDVPITQQEEENNEEEENTNMEANVIDAIIGITSDNNNNTNNSNNTDNNNTNNTNNTNNNTNNNTSNESITSNTTTSIDDNTTNEISDNNIEEDINNNQ